MIFAHIHTHTNTLTTIILRMVISDIKAFLLALGSWAKQTCPVDCMVVAQLVVLCDIDATIIDPLQRVQTQWFQCRDSHYQQRVAPSERNKFFQDRAFKKIYIRLFVSKSHMKSPWFVHHHWLCTITKKQAWMQYKHISVLYIRYIQSTEMHYLPNNRAVFFLFLCEWYLLKLIKMKSFCCNQTCIQTQWEQFNNQVKTKKAGSRQWHKREYNPVIWSPMETHKSKVSA